MKTIHAVTEYRESVQSDDGKRSYEIYAADNGDRVMWSVKRRREMIHHRIASGDTATLQMAITKARHAADRADRTDREYAV